MLQVTRLHDENRQLKQYAAQLEQAHRALVGEMTSWKSRFRNMAASNVKLSRQLLDAGRSFATADAAGGHIHTQMPGRSGAAFHEVCFARFPSHRSSTAQMCLGMMH